MLAGCRSFNTYTLTALRSGVVCTFFLALQLVTEVRQQLQEGAGHAAAVEHVARKRLSHLVGIYCMQLEHVRLHCLCGLQDTFEQPIWHQIQQLDSGAA
jgi:hypothetical protein